MHLIAQDATLRFAVLPIGDNFTMGAHDAAKAAGMLKCHHVVGVHYDTFPFIMIDYAEAEAISRERRELELVPIGGSVEL
jgi:L-ascorbate metabolism protein UlaG (beta-lactamase superfamily)